MIAEALERFGAFLTDYEKKEATNYSEIWFLGLNACKIRSDENAGTTNYGYDDENGNYNKVDDSVIRVILIIVFYLFLMKIYEWSR